MYEFNEDTKDFLRSVDYREGEKWTMRFSPTRWPYTYAYDFVRTHTTREDPGRGGVGEWLRDFLGKDEERKSRICEDLARAYCEEVGITIPSRLLQASRSES